jgi:pantoate--beta-alanine ligase
MRTLRTVAEVRAALAGRPRDGASLGLVPTMGGFHEGHLSLIRRARMECDVVVVSLFVNPTQFDDPRDLEAYPRDEHRDAELAARLGVNYLFAPAPQELYPEGFATTISVARLTRSLEGSQRGRGHFDGVSTVVAKLLNIVGPDVAYFGQKDAQQAVVIRRLVADLNFPVRIEVCPTIREPDGLAMSSRNAHLNGPDRARAASLYRALRTLQEAIDSGQRDPDALRDRALGELATAGISPEYLELVSAATLEPVSSLDGQTLAVVAARVGSTRLIDNLILEPDGSQTDCPPLEVGASENQAPGPRLATGIRRGGP